MSKIFGEEHFIDNTMIDLIEDYGNKLDRIIYDEMTKTIKYTMPEVKVDEQKLRDWIVLCMKLENIDKSDLVDIAVKKKFADKDEELANYKGALNLACIKFEENDKAFLLKSKRKSKEQHQKELLDQAKKELEGQDGNQ